MADQVEERVEASRERARQLRERARQAGERAEQIAQRLQELERNPVGGWAHGSTERQAREAAARTVQAAYHAACAEAAAQEGYRQAARAHRRTADLHDMLAAAHIGDAEWHHYRAEQLRREACEDDEQSGLSHAG
ncbi:hypothetical protein [Nonomuraea sp. NPDC003804]|uniref:hypothetical protein n=1 Tax=Nonomuraea sp. NPDC003804 TaxID=3154547 RepID=UPI0033B195AD